MTTLIYNIKTLVNTRESVYLLRGSELQQLPCLLDAYLVIEDEVIAEYGVMRELNTPPQHFSVSIDASGRLVLPAWCDSHTHLVYAGSREQEFVDKIKGLSYAEIAAKGGGILNTARLVNEISEEELFVQSWRRLQEVSSMGTGAIEVKSGYGLTVEGEMKMLRVIRKLKEKSKLLIKSSFLGAHTIPAEFRENRHAYIELIVNEMLPQIGKEKLADYIDVFCDQGFFTPAETELICKAGIERGLKPKIHANQLAVSGGVQAGISVGAVSVDHLEHIDDEAIESLSNSKTVGTLLPTAAFFLRMPFQPARELIDRNCAIALASDYNPGSSPSGNMNFVIALSCIQMRMLPEEALNAATTNGAFAMEVEKEAGTISIGKRANLIITKKIPSINYIPYAFANNFIHHVMIAGEWITSPPNNSTTTYEP